MQKIYMLGALLLAPIVTFAHAEELHPTTAWYQDPMIMAAVLAAVVAFSVLGYGFVTAKPGFVTIPTVALVAIAITSLISFGPQADTYEPQLAVANFGAGQSVTLYKTPNCGCCSGHAKALEEAGFAVTIEETNDLDAIKQSKNIPADGAGCHTSVIGDYVVEGHVPLEAIEKLLTEKPDIAGIGIPGMPIGTPGMPGPKTASYEVYELSTDGEMSPYITL